MRKQALNSEIAGFEMVLSLAAVCVAHFYRSRGPRFCASRCGNSRIDVSQMLLLSLLGLAEIYRRQKTRWRHCDLQCGRLDFSTLEAGCVSLRDKS